MKKSIGKYIWHLIPWVLSAIYVLTVFALPLLVNLEYCNSEKWKTICKITSAVKLNEFDKWGSYLSGALVPLSLLWVGMAFRLQQKQLAEQGQDQINSANTAYQAQKITDRQTLISMAGTYIERMEDSLRDFASLVDSNAPRTPGTIYGPVLDYDRDVTNKDVGYVLMHLHNLLICIDREEVLFSDIIATKALFVDTDISDVVNSFFEIYNEFHSRCVALQCLILIPPFITSTAHSLKHIILRSTCRWHVDQQERDRLKYLIGWTDEELKAQFLIRPEDGFLDPFPREEN